MAPLDKNPDPEPNWQQPPLTNHTFQTHPPAMEHIKSRSIHCTQNPALPQDQADYLKEILIDVYRSCDFDFSRVPPTTWDAIADKFNAKFEGKRIPGCAYRQSKQSVRQIQCAYKGNEAEFWGRLHDAFVKFKLTKQPIKNGDDWAISISVGELVIAREYDGNQAEKGLVKY